MSITKKLASVFAGVVVAFVAFGMMASSASAISAQALMDMGLTAEQAAVVAALFAEEESSSCVAVDTTTTMGVQTAVNDLGYLPALTVDGVYGPATSAGVAYLQTMVGAAADGVFGPATRAAYNAYVAANCDDEEEMMEEEEEEESNSSLSGGETSLENWNLDSEDDAQEGSEEHVATIEFDVEDADAMINRIDVSFDNSSVGGTADDEPWDVFETLTLMVDGDEIASEDIDDEDDWLDDDGPVTVYRLSGLDYVLEEGEEAEIEIHLTAAGNVDDAANADWIIFIDNDGLRALDSEGINSYFGLTTDTVAFGVDEEGGDESIEVKSSSDDYDASLLKVEEDTDSDWYDVFKFRLEAEENDIEIEDLVLDLLLTDVDYVDAVNDVKVEIDGEAFDDFTVDLANPSAAATDARLTFDIDKDHTVDADDTVDVVVMIEFKEADMDDDGTADGAYDDATAETVQVQVVSVSGEGVDDVSDAPAGLTSEVHTLTYAAALIESVSWTATPNPNGGNGTIDFLFTVDNTDGDEDFVLTAADIVDTATAAFTNAASFITASGEGTLTRVSGDSAPATGILSYTIAEGNETRFRVRYVAPAGGTFEANIESVAGVEIDSDDQLSPTLVI